MRALALALTLIAAPAMAQNQVAPGVEVSPPFMGGMPAPGVGTPGYVPPGMVDSMVDPMPAIPSPGQGQAAATPPMQGNGDAGAATAAEQGLVDHSQEEEARRMMEDIMARSTARQRGIVVHVPTLANPVSTDPASREWLHNWEFILNSVGVSKTKVRFEASRLSRDDFESWASRQYRFRQSVEDHGSIRMLRTSGQ